jgi:predicted dehydrogenase
MIRVGVVGLGFMGRTHVGAIRKAAAAGMPCGLVAVADPSAERRRGEASSAGNLGVSPGGAAPERLFDPGVVRAYPTPHELFEDRGVDLVCVCTPTDTHVDLATLALRAGKHVLLEKPVALRAEPVGELARVAAGAARVCMPAMCMRFWPAWAWVRAKIVSGEFGRVRTARFERLGAAPAWGGGFYQDEARCGGAIFDLHVHDTDFVHFCFGAPTAVHAVGSASHVSTRYTFERGPGGREAPDFVIAEGGWLNDAAFAYRMRYVVEFDAGVADFDIGRTPQLIWYTGGVATHPDLAAFGGACDGYDMQLRHVVTRLAEGEGGVRPDLADAFAVTRTLEAELASVRTQGRVALA